MCETELRTNETRKLSLSSPSQERWFELPHFSVSALNTPPLALPFAVAFSIRMSDGCSWSELCGREISSMGHAQSKKKWQNKHELPEREIYLHITTWSYDSSCTMSFKDAAWLKKKRRFYYLGESWCNLMLVLGRNNKNRIFNGSRVREAALLYTSWFMTGINCWGINSSTMTRKNKQTKMQCYWHIKLAYIQNLGWKITWLNIRLGNKIICGRAKVIFDHINSTVI